MKQILIWPARVLGALVLIFLLVVRLPVSWFYRDRKPTRLGKRGNALVARIYGLGIVPGWLVNLKVPGRRSGRTHSAALVVAMLGDERYLVSMLGESEWVRNVRANGGNAILEHGRSESVRLEEVPDAERAAIIKEYLRTARGARPHIEVDHRAPLSEFEKVAHHYPVFRVVSAES